MTLRNITDHHATTIYSIIPNKADSKGEITLDTDSLVLYSDITHKIQRLSKMSFPLECRMQFKLAGNRRRILYEPY